MRTFLSAGVLTIIALIGLLTAGAIYYGFVRPIVPQEAGGTITAKVFQDVRNLRKVDAGPRRELWSTTDRKLPDGYVFEIVLDHSAIPIRYFMERTAGERFVVGQRVIVTFDERGFPPVWSKRYVRSMMTPASH